MNVASKAQQPAALVLSIVSGIMFLASGFGSLLAAWAAADAIASEMPSGTILAVMARPVRRWEFLLGKYLGVQLWMLVYIAAMLLLSYLLAWLGGERIHSFWWRSAGALCGIQRHGHTVGYDLGGCERVRAWLPTPADPASDRKSALRPPALDESAVGNTLSDSHPDA